MKQYAENNRIGICHPLRGDGMYEKSFANGYPYINGGIVTRSSKETPIYSYGKNYTINGKDFALFVWSTDGNRDEVEKELDKSSKEITEEQIDAVQDRSTFDYVS